MFSFSTNSNDRRWRHSPTARWITTTLLRAAHSLLMHHFSLSMYDLQMKMKQQIFNDFVVSIIFWPNACATQYELIVVNGQTATSAYYKVA